MGLLVRLLLGCLLLSAGLVAAPPAEARWGAPIERFERSALIAGDRLFRYEGRVGARYRFSGARRCTFGNGLLAVDVEHQRIVQMTLVLPLPQTPREEVTLRGVVNLFVAELGLDLPPEEVASVRSAFLETLKTARRIERPLGKGYELRTYCQPQLGSIMMVVGLKP